VFTIVTRSPIKNWKGVAPKFRLVGLTEMIGGGMGRPLPVSPTVSCGFAGSSEVIVKLPFAPPVVVGVKVTVTVRVVPGATTRLGGVALNVAPVTAMELIVRSTPPVLWSVSGPVPDKQTATLPRFKFVGEMLRCGREPIPDSGIVTVGRLGSFVCIVRLAVSAVSAFGANVTTTDAFPPAPMAKGPAGLAVKRGLELWMLVTFNPALPALWMMSVSSFVKPTLTVPKARAVGETLSDGALVNSCIPSVEMEGREVLAVPITTGGVEFRSISFT
jgi:hypothetical protein